MAQWSVYMVRCKDGALYTGIATDVSRRIVEHAQNKRKGAKYLRGKGPLLLVFVRAIGSKDLALRVESQIKKLSRARKEELIEKEFMVNQIVDWTVSDML
jgi:putative endonuclease